MVLCRKDLRVGIWIHLQQKELTQYAVPHLSPELWAGSSSPGMALPLPTVINSIHPFHVLGWWALGMTLDQLLECKILERQKEGRWLQGYNESVMDFGCRWQFGFYSSLLLWSSAPPFLFWFLRTPCTHPCSLDAVWPGQSNSCLSAKASAGVLAESCSSPGSSAEETEFVLCVLSVPMIMSVDTSALLPSSLVWFNGEVTSARGGVCSFGVHKQQGTGYPTPSAQRRDCCASQYSANSFCSP